MIVDFYIGGVLIPGLLVIAVLALVATIAAIRLLRVLDIYRLFAYRPLVELAAFTIIYSLIVQYLR
ncbi:DUF1656 domain-containing protein [Steroidobacter flavus]|uniref:DUF1656 domain-containing protein n=1 Tax=Steroidobacter flavus TaxID=1842136 RepID=A0ABV8T348_9GAMM